MPKTVRRKIKKKKKSKNKKKRKSNKSGASGGKRQKTSGDASEIGETKQSDALSVIPLPLITKEDGAAARRRQGNAKASESRSTPCIANIIGVKESFTFSSRLEAADWSGMLATSVVKNIKNNGISTITRGVYEGQSVKFSNETIESIWLKEEEIKPAPRRSERVQGQRYVHNGNVYIWDGYRWKCLKHKKRLERCVPCSGGASICLCGINRDSCPDHRVLPFLRCTKCPQTCTSAYKLEEHMRTHTGEKPHKCELCSVKFAQNSHLTQHKGRIHDIGNEQCTKCHKNCYRPRSWIDPETTEVERSCKKCYQDRFGVNIREEQEWSDWLDERFYPEFRTGTNTRISMCTLFFPDGLYEFEGHMILYVDHLILHWEFDERQHCRKKNRGDENRMLQMHGIEKHKDKQWVTVRVNPHGYTHPARKAKPGKEERKELMLKVMKACLTKLWESRTHVVYMFYSKDNNNIAKNISKTMLYDAEDVDNFCI